MSSQQSTQQIISNFETSSVISKNIKDTGNIKIEFKDDIK